MCVCKQLSPQILVNNSGEMAMKVDLALGRIDLETEIKSPEHWGPSSPMSPIPLSLLAVSPPCLSPSSLAKMVRCYQLGSSLDLIQQENRRASFYPFWFVSKDAIYIKG